MAKDCTLVVLPQRRSFKMIVVLWQIILLCSIKTLKMEGAAEEICTIDETYSSLICRDIATSQHFPESVPLNIRSVTLIGKDFLNNSFPNGLFLHPSWMNVSELTISKFQGVEFIEKSFLAGLHELRYLSISLCIHIQYINQEVFDSTPNLQALHLDEDFSLTFSATERAIRGKVNRLHFLSLKGLQRYSSSVLSKEFASALDGKNLIYLDISSANVVGIDYTVLDNAFSNLRYLNLSYTVIAITENSTIDLHRVASLLEVLDVSGCPHFMEVSNERSWSFQYSSYLCNIFHQVNYYVSRNMLHPDPVYNVVLDFSGCNTTNVLMWDLSNSTIRLLNMTMNTTYIIHSMRKVDLSKNGLEYLSPSFLGVFPSLIILNLADNQLYKMQSTEDFRNLFHRNKFLKILSLRSNQLEFIPFDLFSPLADIRVLDVGHNILTTFDVNLSGNLNIALLNLSDNWLVTVPVNTIIILEEIFRLQIKGNNNIEDFDYENLLIQSFEESNIANRYRYRYNLEGNISLRTAAIPFLLTIDISSNPLWQDCPIMHWTGSTSIRIIGNEGVRCVEIQAVSVGGYIFIIGITLGCCTCTCTCTCCVCVCCRRNTKKKLQRLRRYFKTHNREYRYVAFVPYCSRDSDIVEREILPVMNNYLKAKLAVPVNLICTGKDNFIPGLRIINEIHRCLDESLVMVPAITQSFLQSRWSLEELVVASEKGKNILILLEDQTDVSDATETVKNLIARYTRATWSRKEGKFAIRPSWNGICQSVINLAGTTLMKEKKQEAEKHRNQLPTIEETVL